MSTPSLSVMTHSVVQCRALATVLPAWRPGGCPPSRGEPDRQFWLPEPARFCSKFDNTAVA